MIHEDEWVKVEGFPGYSVNPLGQVRKDSNGRIMRPRINQDGVAYIGLMRNDRQHIRSLSRLVALTFLPSPNNIFDTPINLDGDRTNCRVDNLMWRPRWYAVRYTNQFTTPYHSPIYAPIRAVETGETFLNSMAAACRYGLLEYEVVKSITNRTLSWPTLQRFEVMD